MRKRLAASNRILLIAAVAITIISQTGCSQKREPVTKEAYHLDTICNITVYAMTDMTEKSVDKVIDGAYDICEYYEGLLSKTVKGSDIYNINHSAGNPVECDPETVSVIEKGIYYYGISAGRFDITIGHVTDLWDFHAAEPEVPDDAEIKKALDHVGCEQINIEGNTVTMADPEGEIDLGAVAKGYIADKMAAYIRAQGVTGAVVDLGGNLSVIGYKDGESTDVRVGIKKPFAETGGLAAALPVHDRSLVTSGIYERCFRADGKLYHHILDVNTGYPVNTDVQSVTIIGPEDKGVDCDALATVSLIIGREEATRMIEDMDGFEAVFIASDGTVTKTGGVEGLEVN